MDLGIRGKVAVVMGGSRGIGLAIASRLAEEGAAVAICARGERALTEAREQIAALGSVVLARACDVSSPAALNAFLEHVRAELGRVDVLVPSATAGGKNSGHAAWMAALHVDLLSVVNATRTVVPWMADAGGGAIVCIASVAAVESGWPQAYSAAKAGLVSFAKNVALECGAKGIRVNVVLPGPIEIPGGSWDGLRERDPSAYAQIVHDTALRRLGTPGAVADAVAFLASERASHITGSCLAIDGGLRRANI